MSKKEIKEIENRLRTGKIVSMEPLPHSMVGDRCAQWATYFVPGTKITLCRDHANVYRKDNPHVRLSADRNLMTNGAECTWRVPQKGVFTIYIGNPAGSLAIETAKSLRAANSIARKASAVTGHARVEESYKTVSIWEQGQRVL
jgi:hypothetical protein